jgi:hypothetical protein
MELAVLPYRLILASLPRSSLPQVTWSLLKLAFLVEDARDGYFFSFTETPREISLILDVRYASLLPSNIVTLSPQIWRCLEIYPGGDTGFNEFKTVHAIAQPLANAEISIFQVSTFESDFTLVAEDSLERALGCLKPYFRVLPMTPSSAASGGHETFTFPVPVISHRSGSVSAPPLPIDVPTSSSASKQHQHPFSFPVERRLFIASLREQRYWDAIVKPLMKLMFYHEEPSRRIFSFTRSDRQVSLILDQPSLSEFGDMLNVIDLNSSGASAQGSGVIEVIGDVMAPQSGLGFDEVGIVASFTAPLARAGISCFYLSTFMSDFILVGDFDEAVKLLSAERVCLGRSL